MSLSPASVVALLLLVASFSLIAVTAIFVQPRPVQGPRAERPPAPERERGQRERRRAERRVAARRAAEPKPDATPAPAAPAPTAQPPAPPPVAAPRETAVAAPVPAPETVVAAYYRALAADRFERAWSTLTPAVQAAFGGFEHWRAGYATTLASRPHGIAVERDGTVATVAHELVTDDRSPCGPVRRRFDVRWRLVLAGGAWRAASLAAVKRSGPEPAAACPARHDAARAAAGR